MQLTRTPFIPARSSRHRIAAIALYRALVKAARAIPLPPNEQPQNGQEQATHPVEGLVRRRFDKNKLDTSPRLVYSSMAAGYKFLTVLTKARTQDSPEHARVVNLLEQAPKTTRRRRSPTPTPKEDRPPPLLTNIAAPGQPPKYAATLRPKSAFEGPRRVPSLASISEGQPFVRYTRPQPKVLSNMIGRKRILWQRKVTEILLTEEEVAPSAALEDEWEDLVRKQSEAELGISPPPEDREAQGTYLWSVMLGKLWWEYRLERTWEDWVARGEALHDLVRAERALAEREGNTPRKQRLGEVPPLDPSRQPPVDVGRLQKVSVSRRGLPTLDHGNEVGAQLEGSASMYDKDSDPFASPIWEGIVHLQIPRLKRWMVGTQHWNQAFIDLAAGEKHPLLYHSPRTRQATSKRRS